MTMKRPVREMRLQDLLTRNARMIESAGDRRSTVAGVRDPSGVLSSDHRR
jgi:hypothetical protein